MIPLLWITFRLRHDGGAQDEAVVGWVTQTPGHISRIVTGNCGDGFPRLDAVDSVDDGDVTVGSTAALNADADWLRNTPQRLVIERVGMYVT